jgi:CRISPR-associated protein Csb1
MTFIDEVKASQGVRVTESLMSLHPYVKLPSYAADQEEGSKKPQYVRWPHNGNGSINGLLDSVQSQGNRIEPLFAQYPQLVPAITVKYPNRTISLLDVPNRAADPAVRYLFETELKALATGDPLPLAKKNPTALIFGLYDSRATMINVPRAVAADVTVRNAAVRPVAASLTTPFSADERADLIEKFNQIKLSLSEAGIDQVPVYNEEGAVDVNGATIERVVVLSTEMLERYRKDPVLHDYLISLAVVATLAPTKSVLRSGTTLVRQSRKVEVFRDLQPAIVGEPDFGEVVKYAEQAAQQFADKYGFAPAEELVVSTVSILADAKRFSEGRAAKKQKKNSGGNKK